MAVGRSEDAIFEKVYEKVSTVVARRIAGEMFLVPISGNLANMDRIFALSTVAEFIWERLDGRMNLRGICGGLLDRFDVPEGEAKSDIQEFVNDLVKQGLAHEVSVGP